MMKCVVDIISISRKKFNKMMRLTIAGIENGFLHPPVSDNRWSCGSEPIRVIECGFLRNAARGVKRDEIPRFPF